MADLSENNRSNPDKDAFAIDPKRLPGSYLMRACIRHLG